jgi:hypothetical protein
LRSLRLKFTELGGRNRLPGANCAFAELTELHCVVEQPTPQGTFRAF